MKPDPVEAYHNAWQAERFPDLFAFLTAWPNLSDEDIVHLVQ